MIFLSNDAKSTFNKRIYLLFNGRARTATFNEAIVEQRISAPSIRRSKQIQIK